MQIKSIASSSKGNCYIVDDGRTKILIECGIAYKEIQKALNFGISSIDGVLVSHPHKDHCRSVKDMIKAGIDVYLSEVAIEEIGISGHRINAIYSKKQFSIGTFIVLPFELQHDVFNLGFLLANQAGDKLLYATDTYYIRYCFHGLTHIMIEANYCMDILKRNVEAGTVPKELKSRILKSHFSLENVKEFLKANDLSKVQEIWLLHLSDVNSDAELFRREVIKTTGKPVYIA
jgi:phosphoribosyl 1,2-cyclic phosphodiesterase